MDIVLIIIMSMTAILFTVDAIEDSPISRSIALFIQWISILIIGLTMIDKYFGL